MSRIRLLFAILLGLTFPLALALGTYVASAGSLAEPVGEVVVPRGAIAEPSPRAPTPASPGAEDVSGPCDEVEHADDPRCTGETGEDDDERSDDRGRSGSDDDDDDDRSGSDSSGSDDDDDSGSDNSGSGKGESGGDD